MNRLSPEKRLSILHHLVTGSSIIGTARLVKVSPTTVNRLLLEVGANCLIYSQFMIKNLKPRYVQCDEIWNFCTKKAKAVKKHEKKRKNVGDIWTFVSIDPETKLVINWASTKRNQKTTDAFIWDLVLRLDSKVQISTDGMQHYASAIEEAFEWQGKQADYGQVVKNYENEEKKASNRKKKKKAKKAAIPFIQKRVILGDPDMKKISTSIVERQNRTMRAELARFMRKTGAHSRSLSHHILMQAIYFMHYNFVRQHMTLNMTPAMAAGLENRFWSLEDLLNLQALPLLKELKQAA